MMEHESSTRFTARLRLEPVGPANAGDLGLVHNDDEVAQWYEDRKLSAEEVDERAKHMGESWRSHGVHKWIAYDRVRSEVVGRGGLSLRRRFWGHGYASEIGRAGLEFAFDVLGAQAVVSCTVRHNVRSRAVM